MGTIHFANVAIIGSVKSTTKYNLVGFSIKLIVQFRKSLLKTPLCRMGRTPISNPVVETGLDAGAILLFVELVEFGGAVGDLSLIHI